MIRTTRRRADWKSSSRVEFKFRAGAFERRRCSNAKSSAFRRERATSPVRDVAVASEFVKPRVLRERSVYDDPAAGFSFELAEGRRR